MNKWSLLATVALIAVLGVCYSLVSHQNSRHGAATDASDEPEIEDDSLQEKGDNTYSLEDAEDGDLGDVSGATRVAPPTPKQEPGSPPLEMLEDDEEDGETIDPGADDDEGILEPAVPPRRPLPTDDNP